MYIVVAHIPISLLNLEGVACRIFFTSIANTPKSWWEDNVLFYAEGKQIFRNFANTLIFEELTAMTTQYTMNTRHTVCNALRINHTGHCEAYLTIFRLAAGIKERKIVFREVA